MNTNNVQQPSELSKNQADKYISVPIIASGVREIFEKGGQGIWD